MKKNLFILGMMAVLTTLLFVSCTGEDPVEEVDPVVELINSGELKGVLNESVTLKASTNYKLTGSFMETSEERYH